MSEFSESYHLRSERTDDAIELLCQRTVKTSQGGSNENQPL
jgi:hypothetical protein